MKVIIQLQYSLTDSRVFHDLKNITQSSLHPTQPNPTHGWTQPMTNSGYDSDNLPLNHYSCSNTVNRRSHRPWLQYVLRSPQRTVWSWCGPE